MAEALEEIPMVELVPHDPPMMLLDRFVEASDTHCICELRIRPGISFFEDGGVPAFVGIEYMAQAIAANGGYRARKKGEPPKVGFLLGSPKFSTQTNRFKEGQHLRVEATLEWGDGELMNFACAIIDQDTQEPIQEASLNVFEPKDLDAYLSGVQQSRQQT